MKLVQYSHLVNLIGQVKLKSGMNKNKKSKPSITSKRRSGAGIKSISLAAGWMRSFGGGERVMKT